MLVTVRIAIAIILSALCAAIGLFLQDSDIPLVDTLDRFIGDWRIALAAPVAAGQNKDIAIVLVSEETLLDYESRSPIDRDLIAHIVRVVDAAKPKVIALDFLLDRRTSKDNNLIAAIRGAGAPVVLAAVDERVRDLPRESLAIQRDLLNKAGRRYGHVLLERNIGVLSGISDTTVRRLAEPYLGQGGTSPTQTFVDVILEASGRRATHWNRVIAWQKPPDNEQQFATLHVMRHRAEDAPIKVSRFLGSADAQAIFKDRIVLVGGAMVDRDRHITPLSVLTGETIHGIFGHAQALAQRLDGDRDIIFLPWPVWWLAGTVLAMVCFKAARILGFNPVGFVAGILVILAVGVVSFLALWIARVEFPSVALTTAWLLGGLAGGLSRRAYPRLGLLGNKEMQ